MINLLARLFIKDYRNYSDPAVRSKYGILCGGFGIFLNILLFAAKFIFGTLAASVSMVTDAFNNLSDAASSLIQILGFKLASRKPDKEHPFGHGRLEYVSGLIISFLILLMGIELIKSSVQAIIHPKAVQPGLISVVILILALLIKLYMYIYNHRTAKKISSVTMEATAKDSLSDTISTFVVIAAVIISRFTTFPVDGAGGIIVGLFIIKTGYEAASDTIRPLLGTAPTQEFCRQIEEEVMTHKPIGGIHDLIVNDYGPGRLIISLHAEVPGDMDIFELHDVIDCTEVALEKKFNCVAVIHMDPVDMNNQKLKELKAIIKDELTKLYEGLKCHDVRMVPGQSHTNVIFDVVKPFECQLSDSVIKDSIQKAVWERTGDQTIFCVITVESSFV